VVRLFDVRRRKRANVAASIASLDLGDLPAHVVRQQGFVIRPYGRLVHRARDEAQAFDEVDAEPVGEFDHVAPCADAPPPREAGRIALSLDTAVKDSTANDYSVCTVWLEADGRHYLLHVWRDRVDFPTLLRKVLDLVAVFRPRGSDRGRRVGISASPGAAGRGRPGGGPQGEGPEAGAPLIRIDIGSDVVAQGRALAG